VRNGRRVRLTWAATVIISMCFFGCAKAPNCKVSPVELEELREDIAQLQKDLKTARDREAQLQRGALEGQRLHRPRLAVDRGVGEVLEGQRRTRRVARGAGDEEEQDEGAHQNPYQMKVVNSAQGLLATRGLPS